MSIKWLLARRAVQLGVLGLFWAGIAKGNLSSSLTLGTLPLTDPLSAVQALLAHHTLGTTALLGAVIVAAAYALVGGRAYCAWVCPLNAVTDAAAWLRRRLGLKETIALDRRMRFWVLAGVLLAAAAAGTMAWEMVNPVAMVSRGLIAGTASALTMAALAALAVFLFDLGIAANGWCGHLCPVGAFYHLLGRKSLVRVTAAGRDACDNCMDCFQVCPERHVIAAPLRGKAKGISPVIQSADCTNCGRCIDVCSKTVFRFGSRFSRD
ncbi:MAG: quinol dehydrogenase ferredoxin subunit NapH [Rhodospirillaceae bacterium]|nr:quinol dehydrogenase ferredoxin subunit NapH [Rhodospirillales bacterium]